jgi:glutamate N-acetyltransferase/amino-acid N-acetyltransferase
VTELPRGFSAASAAAGLKPSGAPDVGLLVSDRPANAVGVFTANRVQAAPVAVSRRHLRTGRARAIVVNAGNANACTGSQGIADARATAATAARALGATEKEVLVASTGVIGRYLDMPKLRAGVETAASALGRDAEPLARAMMTTDTRPKLAMAEVGDTRIVGIIKGAGMIAPEMATMLCFVATDAAVTRGVMADALRTAAAGSFNAISVDGCMSTNDCVLLLANGAAGSEEITADHPAAAAFSQALAEVCSSLAHQVVADGEGATKVVAIRVQGASNEREAARAARTIADSVLLRCALGGADPNWGRVLAALGVSGIPFDPNVVDVWMGGEKVAERGAPGPGDLVKAALGLKERDLDIVVDMARGGASATVYTNDLTAEYVRINGEYTT